MSALDANPNTHWASIVAHELALAGLEAVCIAPGSRSTPLALAFAAEPAVRLYRHLDERSAGFFALGMALQSGKPVALVCTSGTATANFHPAVIEAYYSGAPLLVLTADRPPELRESGANQTIDQIKMFSDHVRWAVEVPVPQADAPPVTLRHLRTLAARAYAVADGLVKGPVHLNFPFRKPLEPDQPFAPGDARSAWLAAAADHAFTQFARGRLIPTTDQISDVADLVMSSPRGLILCGPRCPGEDFPEAVAALSRASGYPVLADPLSGVRFGSQTEGTPILGGYDLWMPRWDAAAAGPEVVIRFGAVPTSSTISALLDRATPAVQLLVREDGLWADDLHRVSAYLQVEPAVLAYEVAGCLSERDFQPDPAWSAALQSHEAAGYEALGPALDRRPFFDGAAVTDLLEALPDGTLLFAGNSLAVRHVDQYGRPSARRLHVFGNRGASGIDGNVSTALGIAAAAGRPIVALLGDITFYHDMNGLLALRQHGLSATFVVMNNDGGGIFHRLPVARHEPPFNDLFLTPHGLSFEGAAELYGLEYWNVANRQQFRQAIEGALEAAADLANGPARNLIEVRTDSRLDYRLHSDILNEVREALPALR